MNSEKFISVQHEEGIVGKITKYRKRTGINRQKKEPVENTLMGGIPTPMLIEGINASLQEMEKRGVRIKDWDDKERKLYRIKSYGSDIYFLAAGDN